MKWCARGACARAAVRRVEPAPKQHPSNSQAAPKQHPISTQTAPAQHPSNTKQRTPGGTDIGFVYTRVNIQ
eukprot:7716211-Lingulodinium_polyedra.AAC.1